MLFFTGDAKNLKKFYSDNNDDKVDLASNASFSGYQQISSEKLDTRKMTLQDRIQARKNQVELNHLKNQEQELKNMKYEMEMLN